MGPWSLRQRLALAFVGLVVVLCGVGALVRGQLHYLNYWGGAVFAPFAISGGGLAILVAIVQGKRGV